MIDSTSYAALDLVWDTLDATIVLGRDGDQKGFPRVFRWSLNLGAA